MQLLPDLHRQEAVVLFKFDYQSDLITAIKTLPGVKWSQTKRCWYQPASQFDLHLAFNALKGVAYVDYSAVKTKNLTHKTVKYPHRATIDLPKGYLEKLEQKRYSESTIRTYSAYMKDFLYHFRGRDINTIEVAEVNAYILGLIKEQNISASQQNQRINAIKFYYEKVIGREKQY
ncbi:recombinase, partial [Marinilabiliaceae bacterium JC017]